MRRLDPSISIIAVGGHDEAGGEWARKVVPEVGPYADYIALHTYWSAEPGRDPWATILSGPARAELAIEDLSAAIQWARRRDRRCRDLKIAITEWNATPVGGMMANHPEMNPFGPTYHLRDALAVASFLNIMQRHCREVTLANIAQTINVVGLIMVVGEEVWREPVYWPLWMQTRYSGPVALDALVESETFDEPPLPGRRPGPFEVERRTLEGIPYLDCSATVDPELGKLYLSLVNRHRDQPIVVHVDLPGVPVGSEGTVHLLTHDDPMAMNGPSAPDNVRPTAYQESGFGAAFDWELPAHAYAILELGLR